MQNLEAFSKLLGSPKNIVITTHHKPDADALGSSLGLGGILKKKGHSVHVITPTDYPAFLNWMKGNDEVIIYEANNQAVSKELVNKADVIFCLDFNTLSRINELGELVRASSAVKVLIDHHLEPEHFYDFHYWNTAAAATCELVYELLVKMGLEELIDKDLAECLYAGIMTDTGGFRHNNTTANVHNITAKLISHGADNALVAKLVYDTNSLDRLRFMGYALSEKLTVLPEYRTAFFAITSEELKRFNSKTGDTEGLVNYALSLEGIVLAAVIIDRTEAVKMSFRSIGHFSVNDFARAHFEGGGHRNAAGGKSDESLEKTVEKFLSLLPAYQADLTNVKITNQVNA